MAMSMRSEPSTHVVYPDSDGEPMSESILQGEIIWMLKLGFRFLYAKRPDVLVCADNFWYPVKGQPKIVTAPDTMVIVDLPSPPDITTMGSYRQFEHGGRVLLAAEVLSPSNSWPEMVRKRQFYERHGVEEYWVFDPPSGVLEVWVRHEDRLVPVELPPDGLISPTTGVHLIVVDGQLVVRDSIDGRVWPWTDGIADELARAEAEAQRADTEAQRAETQAQRADTEAQRADTQAQRADTEAQRADTQAQRAEAEAQRAETAERRVRELEARLGDR